MKKLGIPFICLLLAACAVLKTNPPETSKPELEQFFQGREGAFVLYDLNADNYIRYNPKRCSEGFLPASTFKILNTLIGMETGVIPDEDFVIQWDDTKYPIKEWNQDHTLKSAIKNSVVWYYQELAHRVGKQKMQQYVKAVNYGNVDISGNIDSFWLDGNLRISADLQVEFLKRLYANDLPFSKRSMDIVKSLIVQDQTDTYTLKGKTGSVVRVSIIHGWFVGWLETQRNVYFFATNMESSNSDGWANGIEAQKISRNILHSLSLLPKIYRFLVTYSEQNKHIERILHALYRK